jgi:hypothetical protein
MAEVQKKLMEITASWLEKGRMEEQIEGFIDLLICQAKKTVRRNFLRSGSLIAAFIQRTTG